MYLRKSSTVKYLVLIPLFAVLYCEWFVYIAQPLFWENLNCKSGDPSCTKILFIADPQIQGELFAPYPLNQLFIWDSDRYLRSTFAVALKHFKPDVLVYLGDLTDEGSVSTTAQFHSYVKRLFNIFDVYYPIVQIWLPGDNDIGGENEPIRKTKVTEFNAVFEQPSVIGYRNISFYRINAITYSIPLRPDVEDLNYRMAVSHYPIISKGIYGRQGYLFIKHFNIGVACTFPKFNSVCLDRFDKRYLNKCVTFWRMAHYDFHPVTCFRLDVMYLVQVHNAIHPDIYFCAHEHKSKYVRQNKNFDKRETHLLQYSDRVLEIPTDENWIYEIYVPTCSYRMGTSKMGYGAAVLENFNQQLRYTVFWSPQRFPYLILYLLIIVLMIAYNFCYCALRKLYRHKRIIKGDDVLPLLERM